MTASTGRGRSGGDQGTQLRGRFFPTAKAYEALGLPVPTVLGRRRPWWRRIFRRSW